MAAARFPLNGQRRDHARKLLCCTAIVMSTRADCQFLLRRFQTKPLVIRRKDMRRWRRAASMDFMTASADGFTPNHAATMGALVYHRLPASLLGPRDVIAAPQSGG